MKKTISLLCYGLTLLLLTLFSISIAMAVDNNVVTVDQYKDFFTAITSPSSAGKTILINKDIQVLSNITVPLDRSIKIVKGRHFTGNGSITFKGSFEADPELVFTGTGTIRFPRITQMSKVREVLPEWWGAKSDAKLDNSKFLQQAINSLPSGGSIIFQPGSYVIGLTDSSSKSHGVYIDNNDISLIGNDTAMIAKGSENTGYLIEVGKNDSRYVSVSNIKFIGISFIGNADGKGSPSFVPSAIAITSPLDHDYNTANVSNVIISKCSFRRFCTAINAFGVKNINITDSLFTGNVYYPALNGGGYCINLASSYDATISNNKFIATDTDRHAIYASFHVRNKFPQNKNIIIRNNDIDWSTQRSMSYYEAAIVGRCSDGLYIKDNNIKGGYNGIFINTENGDSSDIVISGNTITNLLNHDGHEYYGIVVMNGSKSTNYRIKGLTVRNNTIQSNRDYVNGVLIQDVSDANLTNNQVDVFGEHSTAIFIRNSNIGQIQSNSLRGNGGSKYGINIKQGASSLNSDFMQDNYIEGFKSKTFSSH